MTGDELRAAVEGFCGRPTGGLVLLRGRDRVWRLRATEGGQRLALDGAVGEWLLDRDVLAVRRGSSVETLIWDRDADGAERTVALRVVGLMGERRAERALANLERKVVA